MPKLNMNKLILSILLLTLFSCGTQKLHTKADKKPTPFTWDFSKQKKLIYSYSQTVNSESKMGKDSPSKKSFIVGMGTLTVDVNENNRADVGINDLPAFIITFNEDGSPKDTVKQNLSTNIAHEMKPDGSFDNDDADILFKILFPLPSKQLEVGESEEIQIQIPFNAMGTEIYSLGQNKMTFIGYKILDDRNCAVFKGLVDVSKLGVPDELVGEYKSATTGLATYFFDVENGYYYEVDIQLLMDVSLDKSSGDENGFGMFMAIKNDNTIQIRFKNIEE